MATPPATFVGRRRLLERLLRAAMPDDSQRIDLVTGVLGMGKSSLLLHAELLSSSPEGAFDAHYIDLEPYGDGGSGQGPPSFGAAVQDYELFSSFASAVMTRLAPHTLPKLDASRRAHQERFREVKTLILNVYALNQAGDNSQITSSGVTVNTEETPRNAVDATYIQESRTWIQEESDLLVEGLNSRDTARPALLLLDNVDAVLHRFFGVRLRVLLGRLNGVVVVLAQEPGAEAFYQGADTVPVPPLSESEVRELLEAELVAGPPQDALIPLVHSFSGGVPVAVKVLVDLLNDQDERLEVTDLRARLQRLPRDPESRLNEVVTTMEEHYRGRPLGIALRAASVPDRCNAPLLAKLLPVEGIAPEDAPDLLEDLAGLNVTTQSEGADYYVQIHPFIGSSQLRWGS